MKAIESCTLWSTKLNTNNAVLMQNYYCTITSWLRNNWEIRIFSVEKGWLCKASISSTPWKAPQGIYLVSVLTLQTNSTLCFDIFFASHQGKEVKKNIQNGSFLVLYISSSCSLFPHVCLLEIYFTCRNLFSLPYFSIIFALLVYIIHNVYLKNQFFS